MRGLATELVQKKESIEYSHIYYRIDIDYNISVVTLSEFHTEFPMLYYKERHMKRHRSGTKSIFVLASLIAGLSLTGCGMTQGNLRASTVPANTSAPFTVRSSSVSVDTTAPEIEALNVTIPYGTSLRPEEIATITDDQDASPTLEIASVVDITDRAGQNTASSGSTETAAVAVSAEVAPAAANEVAPAAANEVASAAASEIASVTDTEETEVTAESGATIETAAATETAAVSVTSETAAEVEPANPGYLFSMPGKYNMTLKGADKSGNESTKTIVVTVTDNVAPVFDGLREGFEITDKDKAAPDYLEGIAATDEIDGDVTASIKVDDSKVQYGKAGSYSIEYSVSDTSGNRATAVTPVTVKDTTPPYLSVISSALNLFVTDAKPNYASLVTAIDAVDGNVKESLKVDDSSVKYNRPGEYTTKLSVQDKAGNVAEKAIPVNISAGWKTEGDKTFYYSPKDGHLYHSWSHIGDKTYYFDPDDGHMLTGMQTVDGKQYLFHYTDGHMITGWKKTQGKTYYFSPDDGHMYHSWSTIDGKKYYFDPSDGHLLTGAQTIGGKQYLLDSKDGHLITGWQTVKGQVYYYSPDDGHMYHDWSSIGGKDYYFHRTTGHMLKGALTIDGKQYLLDDDDGHMLTGWQTIDGQEYYYSPRDGHMYHDWSTIDGTEYFFDRSDGHMYTGTHYVDGEEYNFGTSGAAQKVAPVRSSGSSGSSSYSGYAYIGNSNSGKFHKSSCSSVRDMRDYNKVGFDSRSEAINAGYVPCKRCHP